MKRSEAIEIIQYILDRPYDNKAVAILMKLEEAGMSPPEIKVHIHGDHWAVLDKWDEE